LAAAIAAVASSGTEESARVYSAYDVKHERDVAAQVI
jgi:hypothetical protein